MPVSQLPTVLTEQPMPTRLIAQVLLNSYDFLFYLNITTLYSLDEIQIKYSIVS